jgi:Plasmid pRiA4b ORF-3-like protein
MNYDEFPEGEIDEGSVTVLQAVRDERRLNFEYDFGDSWEHEVVIEESTTSTVGLRFAVCLDGANACPPDAVGGTRGYAEFLSAIADPAHDAHANYLEWIGRPFDPTEFDLVEINARLQTIR